MISNNKIAFGTATYKKDITELTPPMDRPPNSKTILNGTLRHEDENDFLKSYIKSTNIIFDLKSTVKNPVFYVNNSGGKVEIRQINRDCFILTKFAADDKNLTTETLILKNDENTAPENKPLYGKLAAKLKGIKDKFLN
jgi:hypothetical protein